MSSVTTDEWQQMWRSEKNDDPQHKAQGSVLENMISVSWRNLREINRSSPVYRSKRAEQKAAQSRGAEIIFM